MLQSACGRETDRPLRAHVCGCLLFTEGPLEVSIVSNLKRVSVSVGALMSLSAPRLKHVRRMVFCTKHCVMYGAIRNRLETSLVRWDHVL